MTMIARDQAFCNMVGVEDPREAVMAYIAGTITNEPRHINGMTRSDLVVLNAAYQYMLPPKDRLITRDEAAQTFKEFSDQNALAELLHLSVRAGMI